MENVLMGYEVETNIEIMKPSKLADIGSENYSWLEWHQRLQKLNQQAIIEASSLREENIKETLVSYKKVGVLVHEAILVNIWKYKILPILIRFEPNPESTFIAYSVLYHEAIAVALLELVMYHESCSEVLEDSAVDLLDYICGTISQLLVIDKPEPELNETGKKEIMRQREDLSFEIGMRSLTIIRYMAEYMEKLSLSVVVQMYRTHDVPVLLVQILLHKPWLRDGKVYKTCNWVNYDGESLIQSEAQVWIALHQLLLNPMCSSHYDMTNSRRSQLLRLQPFLQSTFLDQLSPLIELKQWLCRLSVSDQSTSQHAPILLETMTEIKQNILDEANGKWKKLAKQQLPIIFNKDRQALIRIAQSLTDAYNTDLIEKFEVKENATTCAQCGKTAIQRCSRCKMQWYCSRSCQITHWPQHKEICLEKSQN